MSFSTIIIQNAMLVYKFNKNNLRYIYIFTKDINIHKSKRTNINIGRNACVGPRLNPNCSLAK